MAFLERAKELHAPPPVGSPYSVPIPNSEQPGRSAVYRHWRCQDELVERLDPEVGGIAARRVLLHQERRTEMQY